MAINAADPQIGHARRLLIEAQCIFKRDTELVFFQSGGDIRVGLGINIGVDAQADGRDLAGFTRYLVKA